MNHFVSAALSMLLGWVKSLASSMYHAMTDGSGFLHFLRDNLLLILLPLLAIGVLFDLLIYWARWQPWKVWHSFFRRLFHRSEIEAEEEETEEPIRVDAFTVKPEETAETEKPRRRFSIRKLIPAYNADHERIVYQPAAPERDVKDAYGEPFIPPHWQEKKTESDVEP